MNQFFISKEDRLREWKELRNQSSVNETDEEQLERVLQWWIPAPTKTMTIDPYDKETWPSAWGLIGNNELCRSAVALGMFYTLAYMKDNRWKDRIELALVNDTVDGTYLVVLVDDIWVMNYELYDIVSIKNITDRISIIDLYKLNNDNEVVKIDEN